MNQDIHIPALARVEGEGALTIRLKDGAVNEIVLNIYEPPRFFEGFLLGRYFQDVPDITARICGICPVAYQMSSVQALEAALQVTISPEVRLLRQLLYCAEYIESHALHIYMLQAPDLVGYESAISLAADAPDIVKRALRLKKIGNDLLKAIGGRSVHPVNTCVGGFYRWPTVEAIHALVSELEWAREASIETVKWAATLKYPEFEQDYEFVALSRLEEYSIYDGYIVSTTGRRTSPEEFEKFYLETHVPHSNALHSHTAENTTYFVGPLARINLNFKQLRPIARQAAKEIGLKLPLRNPYKGLLARAIELVHTTDLAVQLAKEYAPTGPSFKEFKVRPGEGYGVSEAPRGLLYHRYVVDEQGLIRFARITPPTAQNFAQMEADLWALAPNVVKQPQEQASISFEHLLRSYDPCISCATHFLNLKIDYE
ncbi:MAG: Ni/Fe hydrogenase subunit alpha [Anaerolineales bacterium]|nr:Ni/Fe hydrogenase subunit alpha [Anaerolineae bacterium]PWB55838.1 MAG: Ni/Fe hydrogenase subunit alpha [Anaerolineales bacterium]